jgi:hypothetical protein
MDADQRRLEVRDLRLAIFDCDGAEILARPWRR